MKRFIVVTIGVLSIGMWISGELLARGGRGGGGHGSATHGGGGAARSAASRTPSMSRPAASRPSPNRGGGGARPGGGSAAGARPGGGGGGQVSRPQGNRQAIGNLPTPNRPGAGIASRPGGGGGGSRPNLAGSGARPGGGNARPGSSGRPSQGQLNNFLDLGGSGGRPAQNRPAARPGSGGNLAGGAANDFLHDRPTSGRPTTLPGRPGSGTNRPGVGDLAVGGDRPTRPGGDGIGNRPGRPGDGNRPERPGDSGNRPGLGDGGRPGRPGDGDNRPGRPGDRPNRPDFDNRPNHRPDRDNDWDRHQNWRSDRRITVNNNWNNNWSSNRRYFEGDWCNHHPNWNYRPGFNYWGAATWPVVAGWFPWGVSQPTYYNYGSNVYYQDDMVYYGTTSVASAADYAYQAEQIATSIPDTPQPEDSWMSLGVFALMPDGGDDSADPTLFLQLAVSKEGVISGTLQNTVSGGTKNVEGMVDRETQRAAWTEVGKTRPIMETGIVNLTQETTPALVHFADDTTQQWLMVRMDQPPK